LRKWELILLIKTNIRLLSKELAKIAETPYFSHELNEYLEQLRSVTNVVLINYPSIPPKVTEGMMDQIWIATKFLSGSTSKRIPYEIAYCLKTALNSWTNRRALITTALIQDKNFYFQGISPEFYTLASAYTSIKFTSELVQIALPQIYQHRPLLNVALYHELGHFLDIAHGIVNRSLLLVPFIECPLPNFACFVNFSQEHKEAIATNHRREYFADLFAASYVGNAYKDFLVNFAGDYPVSQTHPATNDRLVIIELFLSGKTNQIIDLFQISLSSLSLRNLCTEFFVPNILESFSNARPYAIQKKAELHGIFEAGTTYLNQELVTPSSSWTKAGEDTTERVINDLIEKSIRNHMILEKWEHK
jgi:hypothetical protein